MTLLMGDMMKICNKTTGVKLLGVFIIAAGCSADDVENEYDSIEAPELELTHSFDIVDSDETMMSGIGGVHVASDGKIMLTDPRQTKVNVFSEDGEYLHSFMQSGSGPGEVELMGRTNLLSDDRFTVMDFSNRRISMFNRNGDQWEFQYSTAIDAFPAWHYPVDEESWVIYEPSLPFIPDASDSNMASLFDRDGNQTEEELFLFPSNNSIEIQNDDGAPMMNVNSPFTGQNQFGFGDGYLVHTFTDELGVTIYDLPSFELKTSFSLKRPHLDLSDASIEEFASQFEDTQMPADDPAGQVHSQMPDQKSITHHMLYDRGGYIWLKVHSEDDTNPWLIFDHYGELLYNTPIDLEGNIRKVHNGRMYISKEDDSGLPKVRVYEYEV